MSSACVGSAPTTLPPIVAAVTATVRSVGVQVQSELDRELQAMRARGWRGTRIRIPPSSSGAFARLQA
jgi:hypothetical protein